MVFIRDNCFFISLALPFLGLQNCTFILFGLFAYNLNFRLVQIIFMIFKSLHHNLVSSHFLLKLAFGFNYSHPADSPSPASSTPIGSFGDVTTNQLPSSHCPWTRRLRLGMRRFGKKYDLHEEWTMTCVFLRTIGTSNHFFVNVEKSGSTILTSARRISPLKAGVER